MINGKCVSSLNMCTQVCPSAFDSCSLRNEPKESMNREHEGNRTRTELKCCDVCGSGTAPSSPHVPSVLSVLWEHPRALGAHQEHLQGSPSPPPSPQTHHCCTAQRTLTVTALSLTKPHTWRWLSVTANLDKWWILFWEHLFDLSQAHLL